MKYTVVACAALALRFTGKQQSVYVPVAANLFFFLNDENVRNWVSEFADKQSDYKL